MPKDLETLAYFRHHYECGISVISQLDATDHRAVDKLVVHLARYLRSRHSGILFTSIDPYLVQLLPENETTSFVDTKRLGLYWTPGRAHGDEERATARQALTRSDD